MFNLEIKQNTPEWEEFRKDKIGASDAPIIMQVSPFKTPYQLWQEKLSIKESSQNYAMVRGHELESQALACLENQTGLLFHPVVKLHAEIKWMMASLDAVGIDGSIAEIKCPGEEDHSMAVKGMVPEKYFPQLQHQMEVAEVDFAYYFSFDGSNGVLLKVQRDDKYIKSLIEKEKEFWEYLQNLEAPPLTTKDYRNREEEKEWMEVASELLFIREQLKPLKSLESREKELEKLLISMSPRQNSIGGGVKLTHFLRRGTVDYSAIKELEGINLDQYRKKPVDCYRIS